ncbi:MAG: C25 family cysteine peptidase, partial [Polyangiales bacterium]
HQATFSVPEAAMQEGENTLSIEPTSPGSSMLYLDSADLTYTRGYTTSALSLLFGAGQDASLEVTGLTGGDLQLLDVSEPRQPVRLSDAVVSATGLQLATETGHSYFALSETELRSPTSIWNDVPSSLRSDANAADYLLITPAELIDGAQALADYREAEGLSTMLIELQDIYDEFAFGTPDPNAIREFLGYANGNWATSPKFVVLVGKGSFDYRDIQGLGGNLLPAVMVRTQEGLFSSDTKYADYLGDDGMPDVAIGRLPVLSAVDLDSVIQQIIDYEGSIDSLLDDVTMLADATLPQDDFGMSSDAVSEVLPLDWNATAVYRSELGDLESTRALFFDEVRKGPRLVNYLGHAGTTSLGFIEKLFSIDDLETMTIDGTQPLFSNMTCISSRFEIPGLVSLGEAMLLDDEAAVAVWGPSGVSINAQATLLARELMNELSNGDETRIGPMINRAFPVLSDLEFGREMISIYHLFGDPALRVAKADDPGTGGAGGDGGAAGSAGTGGVGGDGGTDAGGGRCSVGWTRPSASIPLLLLLSTLALAWRRRRRS